MILILSSLTSRWRGRHLFKESYNFGTEPKEASSLTTYGTLMRRDSVIEVGNFNQNLRHSEDRELGQRLISAGFKIIGDPNLVVYSIKKTQLAPSLNVIGDGMVARMKACHLELT